jgi:glycosyltransferase involved in cell wall biosynthesis
MCLPELSAGKFFVRDTIFKSLFSTVDRFIAPSDFLLERYVAWGIPRDRATVIENLLDAAVIERSKRTQAKNRNPISPEHGGKVVFGFFAQINPMKGFDVLLEAASLLPDDVRRQVTIRVHGENRQYRDTEFHERTQALLAEARDVVFPMGAIAVRMSSI